MAVDIQNSDTIETKSSVRMQSKKNPVHTRIVSFGAFLLMVLVIFVIADLFVNILVNWLATVYVKLDEGTSSIISLTIRLSALSVFLVSLITGILGHKLYAHHSGRIVQKILLFGVCMLILFTLGIGAGILLVFGIFLWAPRFTVNWSPQKLLLYRSSIVGLISVIVFGELMFRSAIITLFPLFLNLSLYNFSISSNQSWVLIIALAICISLLAAGLIGYILPSYFDSRIARSILIFGFCMFVALAISIGGGLLLIFVLFLWTPRLSENWSTKTLKIYRIGVMASIVLIMFAELLVSFVNLYILYIPSIRFTIFHPFLSLSMNSIVTSSGPSWIPMIPLFLVFPLYLLLPKLVIDIWNYRPKIELFWIEFIHEPLGMVGLVIIAVIVIISLSAPLLAPYHWGAGSLELEDLLQPPSPEHPLGTNQRGEDIYSRLLYGGQISLLVGFTASIVSVSLGTAVGLISGYYGGIVDTILMRITDVFLCLPTLPLMLIFLVIFGQGLQNVIIVIAILGWTGTARMVRSEALSLRERPLTEAAHALGATDGYIILHHVLPNTLPLILANTILGVVNAILNEAGIAFLGFVDIHGQPSWGIILHWAWKNAALLANRWWWFIPPGLLIMLTTLGFVFISHAIDKVVNPRLRKRRK